MADWLSLEQIADELGVPMRTVYSWRNKRTGPVGYRFGKHVRVKRTDLDAWLASCADMPR